MLKNGGFILGALILFAATAFALQPATTQSATTAPSARKIIFNRDVRPILADTCFKCHGFDANKRQAELRLDTREGATAALEDGLAPIVPGNAQQSEAYARMISDDPDEKMPPPKSGIKLT